jgi:hypothetical protein
MGSKSQCLYDAPDSSFSYQLSGFDRAAHLEALREGDRPESAGLRDRLFELIELIQRDTAGLVGDDVLAVSEGLDGDWGASVWNRGSDDHIERVIMEQARRVVDPRYVGPAAPSFPCNGGAGVVRAEPDELAALIEQALDLPEGMGMVQANGGKSNWLTALLCCVHCESVPLRGRVHLGLVTPERGLEAAVAR